VRLRVNYEWREMSRMKSSIMPVQIDTVPVLKAMEEVKAIAVGGRKMSEIHKFFV
jgi:hypothetical protein